MSEKANGVQDWPGVVEAQELSGKSRRQLNRLVEDGLLQRCKDEGGVWRYNPIDLASVQADNHSAPVEEHFKAGTGLLKQAHSHLERIFPLHADAIKALLAALQQENKELRERCRTLEKGYWDAIEAREKLLSEAHDRQLEFEAERAKQERRNRLTKVFEDRAPTLLDGLVGNSKAAVALEFLQTMQPAQISALLETDFVTEEQKTLIRRMMEEGLDGQT